MAACQNPVGRGGTAGRSPRVGPVKPELAATPKGPAAAPRGPQPLRLPPPGRASMSTRLQLDSSRLKPKKPPIDSCLGLAAVCMVQGTTGRSSQAAHLTSAPVAAHELADLGAALHRVLDERQDARVRAVRHHVTQVAFRGARQLAAGLLCGRLSPRRSRESAPPGREGPSHLSQAAAIWPQTRWGSA